MAEVDMDARESLKPYLDKRITVEAHIRKFGDFHDYRLQRRVPSTCVGDVEIIEAKGDDETRWLLTTHVWMMHTGDLLDRAQLGDVIRTRVLVYKYFQKDPDDHNKQMLRYGIRDPLDVEVVRSILEKVKPVPKYEALPVAEIFEAEPEPVKQSDGRQLLTDLLSLIDFYGMEKVGKTLKLIETL